MRSRGWVRNIRRPRRRPARSPGRAGQPPRPARAAGPPATTACSMRRSSRRRDQGHGRGAGRLINRRAGAGAAAPPSRRPPPRRRLADPRRGRRGGRDHRLALGLECVRAGLRDQCLDRDTRLQRGLAAAAGVEVGTRAQHELLGDQRLLAAPEQGREALLGRLHRALDAGGRRPRQLERLAKAPVGHRRAAPVAEPDHERALGRHVAHVRIGRGGSLGAQRPVQDRDRARDLRLARIGRGAARRATPTPASGARERLRAHHGRAVRRHRLGRRSRPPRAGACRAASGARAPRACRARAPPRPPSGGRCGPGSGRRAGPAGSRTRAGRSRRGRAGSGRRATRPRGRGSRACLLSAGSAYLEGFVGTTGFSISRRRAIRSDHWPGSSTASACLPSFLLAPNIGW